MGVISRDAVKPPALPRETVPVPELGGDVVIQGPRASARISMQSATTEGVDSMRPAALLASSVVDKDGQALFTADQWDEWGGTHYAAFLNLVGAAMRLWGFDREENRKN